VPSRWRWRSSTDLPRVVDPPPVISRPSIPELAEVIRRIEEKHRRRPPPRLQAPPLEELLGATMEDTEHGRVLLVRRRFELGHCHGHRPLGLARALPAAPLRLLARAEAAVPSAERLLYLDTETTGLAGGTGTYAFLVGVGFFHDGAFEIRQYFMRDLDEEPALLAAVDGLFRQFDGFVTYNGAGFDLPLLETRFVLARRRWRENVFHVDLLRPARRLWSARLADCRLGTVEHHVLGFRREGDLPGALIPTAYFDYLRRKSPGELPRVFEHNRHDLLSLAVLTGWVAEAVARAPVPGLHPEDQVGVGRLWEAVDAERAAACYRLALACGLGSPSREHLLLRLARHEKRLARWDAAQALWEAAARTAARFDPRPWEEMAKAHEHRRRDLAAARAVVEEALAIACLHPVSERVRDAFEHRLGRLTRRLDEVAVSGTTRQPA